MQVLTWPLLVVNLLMLARGWWLAPSHGRLWGTRWENRATVTLILSTGLSVVLWTFRFAGVLGQSPV
ncbi:MAG: hypothetical protein BZY87_06185 [SAR202 cluster bacterium Io17-Chloro-G6]|nr:MAG: hypothetical protein BZY87_06185 [SAR202 cluster bacterium Io17-Chloro-G6]